MADALSPDVSDRICKHMNDDHAEAVVLYAKVFGNIADATRAEMIAIDAQGMNLVADINGTPTPLRIAFDHELQNSEDAHQTLIAMVKQARMQGKS